MTRPRAIAFLLSLAMLLAGPMSSIAGVLSTCCCDEQGVTDVFSDAAVLAAAPGPGDCCSTEAVEASDASEQERGSNSERDPAECNCPWHCCTVGKTMPMTRAMTGLELPEMQPEQLHMVEPASHAVDPHFSLLRPPRS